MKTIIKRCCQAVLLLGMLLVLYGVIHSIIPILFVAILLLGLYYSKR
jgi:hypothetical protein